MKRKFRIIAPIFFIVLLLTIGMSEEVSALEKGKVGGVVIVLQERLEKPFILSSYSVSLDDKTILEKRVGDKGLSGITINGLPAGKYKVNVNALYTGSGYGLFDYHKDYKYPLESETEVKIEAGRVTNFKIVFNDRDGFLSELDKRPYITYQTGRMKFPYELGEKTSVTVVDEKVTTVDEPVKLDNGLEEIEEIEEAAKSDNLPEAKRVDLGEGLISEINLPVEMGIARYLTGLSIEKENKLRLIVLADGKLDDYQVKKFNKPDRIVIDIKGVREQLKLDSLDVSGSVIKKVRVGQHQGYARIVLDTPGRPFLDYDIKPTATGLIINISDNQDEPAISSGSEKPKSANNVTHLTGISVESVKDGVRVFVAGDGSFADYKSRMMNKPDRLVVDIAGVREVLEVDRLSVNSPLLKGVRVGQHPGMVRVVLDLTLGVKIDYDVKLLSDGLHIAVLEK